MRNYLQLSVIVANGSMQFSSLQQEQLAEFLKGRQKIDLKLTKPTITRSIKQNAFYWSCILGTVAQHTGHSTEDLHLVFKDMFLTRKFIKLGRKEVEVRKTTTDLNTQEFTQYLEQIRSFCAQEMQLTFPEDLP